MFTRETVQDFSRLDPAITATQGSKLESNTADKKLDIHKVLTMLDTLKIEGSFGFVIYKQNPASPPTVLFTRGW